jgi:hypothetical protein
LTCAGNRCSFEEQRAVSKERGEELARRLGCAFLEADARTNVNVREIFTTLVREINKGGGTNTNSPKTNGKMRSLDLDNDSLKFFLESPKPTVEKIFTLVTKLPGLKLKYLDDYIKWIVKEVEQGKQRVYLQFNLILYISAYSCSNGLDLTPRLFSSHKAKKSVLQAFQTSRKQSTIYSLIHRLSCTTYHQIYDK